MPVDWCRLSLYRSSSSLRQSRFSDAKRLDVGDRRGLLWRPACKGGKHDNYDDSYDDAAQEAPGSKFEKRLEARPDDELHVVMARARHSNARTESSVGKLVVAKPATLGLTFKAVMNS